MSSEKTTLGFVTEIGTFGSLPMTDPTVQPVDERKQMTDLMNETTDPHLKAYLKSQLEKK